MRASELFEIAMNPKSLKAAASKIDAIVGIEYEMLVHDLTGEDEGENDYDQDERIYSLDNIRNFFKNEDYGRYNDSDTIQKVLDVIDDEYFEWEHDKFKSDFDDAKDWLKDWLKDNDKFDDYKDDYDSFDDFAEAVYNEDETDLYHEAFQAYKEENEWDHTYDDFLNDDTDGYETMVDIYNRHYHLGLVWPYPEQSGSDMDAIAEQFRRETGLDYDATSDSSLNADEGGGGIEFTTDFPSDVDDAIADFHVIREWGEENGYTNDTCGLHINVSIADKNLDDLDYVKLALFLGDNYVLEKFERAYSSYAKSALLNVKAAIAYKENDELAEILGDMRKQLNIEVSKMIHDTSTEKMTSINVHGNRVEFRGPGNDWLNINPEEIENTIYRMVVALDLALSPDKENKEYAKKLYKLISSAKTKSDVLAVFSKYAANEIPLNELKLRLKQKMIARVFGNGYYYHDLHDKQADEIKAVFAKLSDPKNKKALALVDDYIAHPQEGQWVIKTEGHDPTNETTYISYNDNGQFHSFNDKPAIIYEDGTKEWYKNGLKHRDNGPAVIYANGSQEQWVNGKNAAGKTDMEDLGDFVNNQMKPKSARDEAWARFNG